MAKQNGDRAVMQNAVKTLATNVRFASVDNPVRSIVVTSSIPNEGKSTIAVALSEALASRSCSSSATCADAPSPECSGSMRRAAFMPCWPLRLSSRMLLCAPPCEA